MRLGDYVYPNQRMTKIASNILKNPSLLRKSGLRIVAVAPRSILSKNMAQTFLEMLEKEGIEYSTDSYVIDESQIISSLGGVRNLCMRGLETT